MAGGEEPQEAQQGRAVTAERALGDAMAALGCGMGGRAWVVEVSEGVTTPTGRPARYPVRAVVRSGRTSVRLWYTADGELARAVCR